MGSETPYDYQIHHFAKTHRYKNAPDVDLSGRKVKQKELGFRFETGTGPFMFNVKLRWVKSLHAKFRTKGQSITRGQRARRVHADPLCDLPVSPHPQHPPPARSPRAWHRPSSPSAPIAQSAGLGSISEITMLQEQTKSPLCTGQTFLERHPGLSPLPLKENDADSVCWGDVAGLPILA